VVQFHIYKVGILMNSSVLTDCEAVRDIFNCEVVGYGHDVTLRSLLR